MPFFHWYQLPLLQALKLRCPWKCSWKCIHVQCIICDMYYIFYPWNLRRNSLYGWQSLFSINWIYYRTLYFWILRDLVLGRGRIRKTGRLTRLASWCLPGLFKTSLSISLFQLCTHIMKCKRMMITSLQELPLSWIIFH